MNVLWLCNVMLPRISNHLKAKTKPIGGWLAGLSDDLINDKRISLTVIFPSLNGELSGEIDGVQYVGFTSKNNRKQFFVDQIKKIAPNVIHIFGTEYNHSHNMILACAELKCLDLTLVNIQGLTSIYSKHYYCNLPFKVIYSYTLHDLIRTSNIYHGKMEFEKSGKIEIETLEIAKNISGRTEWDYAIIKQINSSARYFKCNETLRHSFYEGKWDLANAERHSVFVSQSNYPIKGFHLMLDALTILIKKYPDIKLYTTGKNPLNISLIDSIKMNSYTAYLRKQIKKMKLVEHVFFLGQLDEKRMRQQFLKSHVFVCCSSIENSPNSVGEAMLLGVPIVSADVGGVKDMLQDRIDGFIYPYDETYMLAHYIDKIFASDSIANEISANSRKHAAYTHSIETNLNRIIEIYQTIKGNVNS